MISCKKWKLLLPVAFIFVIILFLNISSSPQVENGQVPPLSSGSLKKQKYVDEELNGPSVTMTDPKLVKAVLEDFLIPPPYLKNHSYNLAHPEIEDQSMGQGEKIRSILGNKKYGFFIESGALDGETRTNSLYFERYLHWSGLLIEPDPLNFAQLLTKRRKAWLSPTCVSPKPYPKIIPLLLDENKSRLDESTESGKQGTVKVQCIPLYTYLLALNVTHVDYFSLDIEGFELEVLETIPFDKVNIETLSVEFIHGKQGKAGILNFMSRKGYKLHSTVTHEKWWANDFIFYKSSSP